jgi:hypothetical protein
MITGNRWSPYTAGSGRVIRTDSCSPSCMGTITSSRIVSGKSACESCSAWAM